MHKYNLTSVTSLSDDYTELYIAVAHRLLTFR